MKQAQLPLVATTDEVVEARIGDVYEDTTGMPLDGKPGHGKGTRWKLVGIGCDGMFVGESNGARIRLVSYRGRFKRVEKGAGERIKGRWEFYSGNYSVPLVCAHGQRVQNGEEKPKPHCVGCAAHVRLGEAEAAKKATSYKADARSLWMTCYS